MFLFDKDTLFKNLLKLKSKLLYVLRGLITKAHNSYGLHGESGVINLEKGQVLDLKKEVPALKKIKVCAGWDVVDNGPAMDADLSAFLLKDGKLDQVIYFNDKKVDGVEHLGDNLAGEGEGDDEIITVDLETLKAGVEKLVFVLNIYESASRGQNLSHLKEAFVRIVDAETDNEISRYTFNEKDSSKDALIFCSVTRAGEFTALGEATSGTLTVLADVYK